MKQAADEEMKVLCDKPNEVFKLMKFMRKDGKDIPGAFNKFPDFFCTGIYNCSKLEIFQCVVTILLMR